MPNKIPWEDLKAFAEARGLRQAILFAWDGERTHAVTWGLSVADADQAAAGATALKLDWGWPKEAAEARPSRVQGLIDICRDLERVGIELEAVGLDSRLPMLMDLAKRAHEALEAAGIK
jgi:hypothetical protein